MLMHSSIAALFGPQVAQAFAPQDLGVGSFSAPVQVLPEKDNDPRKLQESLYWISRVQEATAQEERLVSTGKFKDMQRNNIKMALNMMLENYRLADNIVVASGYVTPQDSVIRASQAGGEAVEVLQTAQEYFAKELKVTGLTEEQRKFIVDAMKATRAKLDGFLNYMPAEAVQAARKQVEDENALNIKEYVGESSGGIINPIVLPWKQQAAKAS